MLPTDNFIGPNPEGQETLDNEARSELVPDCLLYWRFRGHNLKSLLKTYLSISSIYKTTINKIVTIPSHGRNPSWYIVWINSRPWAVLHAGLGCLWGSYTSSTGSISTLKGIAMFLMPSMPFVVTFDVPTIEPLTSFSKFHLVEMWDFFFSLYGQHGSS